MMEPFVPPFSQPAWHDLRLRLHQTRWPETVSSGSSLGVDRKFLEDLCAYWMNTFDWKVQLDRLATLHHYRYKAREGYIHFIYEKGRGSSPMPLILTHGWPGSFLEMLKILPLLTDPGAYGYDAGDSFDVVIPSLPGFGYSDRPRQIGMNFWRIAQIWAELMSDLGYRRFAAQGGDLGAGVSIALGLRHTGRIIGIHLNYIPGSYRPYLTPGTAQTASEELFLVSAASWFDQNGSYAHLQGTRPNTPA
jgi:pimeloyl-ACP methyl ester carboxylesterase